MDTRTPPGTPEPLLDALDRLTGTGFEFDGFLANHGPMAAEALVVLDAGDAVPGWVDQYRTRLERHPGLGRPLGAAWRQATGDLRRVPDWTMTLRTDVANLPWRDVLATWWRRLLPGIAASATHGLIRTAHAVRALAAAGERPDPLLLRELADGFALWGARYQPLPGRPALTGTVPAQGALDALPRLSAGEPVAGPGIAGRLGALARLRCLDTALDAYGAPADADAALDDLITTAARVLWNRTDAPVAFCHAVTAPAAIRLVLPHLPPDLVRPSVAAAWQVIGSIVAAFATEPEDDRALPHRLPRPDELVGRAVDHGDEHVIKLTEAVLREHDRTGQPVLLAAAHAFADRVPPVVGPPADHVRPRRRG